MSLPPGRWRYLFDDREVADGPVRITRQFPLEEFPVFARDGAIIPLKVSRPYTGFGDTNSATFMTWLIYPNGTNQFTLWHPESHPHPEKTTVTVGAGEPLCVTFAGTHQPHILRIRADKPPARVALDGRELKPGEAWSFDAERRQIIVTTRDYVEGRYEISFPEGRPTPDARYRPMISEFEIRQNGGMIASRRQDMNDETQNEIRTNRGARLESPLSRREFVKAVTLAGVALGGGATAAAAETNSGDMLYRTLGRTGEKVSAIGVGGYHIGVPAEEEGLRIIRTAIDRGINFMDNCWDYHRGGSEVRMGKALRDGYRDKAFLMTKIDGRTKAAAAKQIDECLQRLQTDRIDLMQHHEIIRMEDPDRIFEENGATAALVEAQKAGKIRYLGFTGHKDPLVHLRALEVAAQFGFQFDAVQMPLNVLDAHFRSFEKQVLPVLVKERIGVLGMKPLASGAVIRSGAATAIECLHYALNLPTSVVITGMESLARLDQACEAVKTFKPMDREQVGALLARTAKVAASGKFEQFKTTANFDGTAHHPEWLG